MSMVSLRRTALVLFVVTAGGALCIGTAGAWWAYSYVRQIGKTLPSVRSLEGYEPAVPTTILSRDGVKIGELFTEKRYPLPLKEISPLLQSAFVAAEDARFFEHSGIDIQGVFRAGSHYLSRSGARQGGSTITQQLAKTLLLSRERTIERKIKDMLLALQIEKSLSKEKILELYLNTIFLGNNSYGVEAAARNYFRKSNKDLSLAEASLIAGLAPAPSAYAPTENLQKAKARQKFVLDQLVKNNKITAEEARSAYQQPLKIHRAESPNTKAAPYFMMEVKKQLEKIIPPAKLTTQGYTVYTTVDMRLQQHAQNAVAEELKAYESRKAFRGAVHSHGADFEKALRGMLNRPFTEDELERAFVVQIFPNLNAVAIVSQQGLGLLLGEDHRWAFATTKSEEGSSSANFDNLLKVGDEIHVKIIDRGTPRRIEKNISLLQGLKKYLSFYSSAPQHSGLRFYSLADTDGVEASALVMQAQTGEVLAMVGGESFASSQFNRATQARRQVGSSVKPLYYGLAQDHGFSPASLLDSPPIVIGDWRPENYEKEFIGRTTLRRSLINSYNIPSIQLFQALGLSRCVEHFHKLGLPWNEKEGGLSLALGAGDATLLQMVQSYSPFANSGAISKPHYIAKIEDRKGKIVFAYSAETVQVLSPQAAYVTTRMMQDVVRFGTGTRAVGVSPDAAGKTGTTNGYTDAWFMGVLPNLVGGVWVGFDDARKSLGAGSTGGKMAAPLWREVMREAVSLYPSNGWAEPSGIKWVHIEPDTGKLISGGLAVPVVVGTEPGNPEARNALGVLGLDGEGDVNNSATEDTSALRSSF